jgi:hypothetical protein
LVDFVSSMRLDFPTMSQLDDLSAEMDLVYHK